MRLLEIVVDQNALRTYSESVIQGGGVSAVWLVGSATHSPRPNDIDLLYVLDFAAPPDAQDDDPGLWGFLEHTSISDEYDSFFQAGQTFWHLTWGAGPSLMRNDEYAREQQARQKILLASRTA
jgi:hypothetical protein